MITLYGTASSRSLRVSWMLEELGLDYDYQPIALMKGEGRSEHFLAINPGGKVPALRDGDLILTESAAIVTYLGDKAGDRALVPAPGSADRGRCDQWCHFVIGELEQPLWTIAKHTFAIPEQYRVPAVIATAEWEFQRALALVSQVLAKQAYILGDQFSAADILIAHTLLWADFFRQTLDAAGIRDYMARTVARPALQRARDREQAA